MRNYKCRIYTEHSYIDIRFQADDYWDAVRRVEAQYPGHEYNYLTEG